MEGLVQGDGGKIEEPDTVCDRSKRRGGRKQSAGNSFSVFAVPPFSFALLRLLFGSLFGLTLRVDDEPSGHSGESESDELEEAVNKRECGSRISFGVDKVKGGGKESEGPLTWIERPVRIWYPKAEAQA